jgi:pyruvate dehydrogenase E1 component
LLRKQVIYGAYKLIDRSMEHNYSPKSNVVNIACSGVMVPEAIKASNNLLEEEIFANVINVTGPGPLYREFQKSIKTSISSRYKNDQFLSDVIPKEDRLSPLITLTDGHPHSLAWLGGALGSPTFPLGVTGYGQSGNPPELYEEYGIDVQNIMATIFSALEM